jgi:hypothetical protein
VLRVPQCYGWFTGDECKVVESAVEGAVQFLSILTIVVAIIALVMQKVKELWESTENRKLGATPHAARHASASKSAAADELEGHPRINGIGYHRQPRLHEGLLIVVRRVAARGQAALADPPPAVRRATGCTCSCWQ